MIQMRSMKAVFCGLVFAAMLHGSIAAQQTIPNELPGLHNVTRLSPDVYTGSEPVGEEAFSSLKQLGIQTIVSVDGARPQIDLASKYGLRYAHIPFGYDAIPLSAQLALTRAARQSRTPLYIHCHHGKHRGPAAAAIVCRAKGLVDTPGALQIMKNAGTSRDYQGLWLDVERYVVPTAEAELPPLIEVAEVESLAAAMARMDRHFDHLKICAAADWESPAGHPDLKAEQEAILLRESLHEASRRLHEPEHATEYDATFREWLTESDTAAGKLHTSLQSHDLEAATTALGTLQKLCSQCHKQYRDRK